MTITVNGAEREVPDGVLLSELLVLLGLAPEHVAVDRNGSLVRRRDHPATALATGDRVEIVTLVGGG